MHDLSLAELHGGEIAKMDCAVPSEFLKQLEREFGPREKYLVEKYAALSADIPDAVVRAAVQPWPISKDCSTDFTAVHHSGTRNVKSIKWIVLHCTQSNSAEAAARWFRNPDSAGSAHLCTDHMECYRTLLPRYIPWAAPGANTLGWHLEIAGFAQWSREQWFAQKMRLDRSAWKAALHAKYLEIPIRLLTVAQLKAGRTDGFTTHWRCTQAFGGTHTDPGLGFPLDWFMNRTRYHAARIDL